MFRRRVGGVYFAIITQAIAAIVTILIIGQQGYTGGVNGITDLRTLHGWDIRTDNAKFILYFVNAGSCCSACILHRRSTCSIPSSAASCSPCATRRIGCGSPATTSRISRSSSSASPPAFAAIGGAMFTLQVGFMSPSLRRHRAVDRDGDLHRRRRPAVDPRRGLRHAAGQLGQDDVLRELPGALAVRPRRSVHRRRAGFPERPCRTLPDVCRAARPAPAWSADERASPRNAAAAGRQPAPTRRGET